MRPPLTLATIVTAVAAIALAGCTGSTEEASTGRSFYAEITADVEPDPDDRTAILDGEAAGESVIRWWYAEGDDGIGRWRWEIVYDGPSIDAGTRIAVFDGEHHWDYDGRSQTYQRAPMDPIPDGLVLSPSLGAQIGPANLPDMDTFIEQWQLSQPDNEIARAGSDSVLGRPTEVIEIRPRDTTRSTGTTSTSGTRISIDPERMFIMRWVVESPSDQSFTLEVSRLDYDTTIAPDRFTFDPPSEAQEVVIEPDRSCSTTMSTGDGFDAPAGFLVPTYIPAGFQTTSVSGESSGCEIVGARNLAEGDNDGFLLLRQRIRPGGIPASLRTDNPIPINGSDAYASEAGGITRLLWSRDGVAAELVSNALPLEELVRIAESAQIRPEDDQQ